MTYLELLKLLMPAGCYADDDSSATMRDLSAHANALADCQANATGLMDDEIWPDVADEYITSWEKVYGLIQAEKPLFQRRQNLLAAINARGGLKVSDIQAALKPFFGYDVDVEEYMFFRTEDPRCLTGLAKYAWDEQSIFNFTIKVDQSRITTPGFNPVLVQAAINRVKPAHTTGNLDVGGNGFYTEDPNSLTELTLTAE